MIKTLYGLFTALGAVAEIYAISLIFKIPFTWDFIIILIVAPLVIYIFDFLGEKQHFQNKKLWIFAIVLSLSISGLTLVSKGILSTLILLILISLGIVYSVYLKSLSRKLVGFKDFFVAFSWNLVVIFYLFYYSVPISSGIVLFLFFVFSRDFINATFCDVKDIESDKENKLLTFAVVLGREKLVKLLYLLNLLSIAILVVGTYFASIPLKSILLVIPVMVTSVLIYVAHRTKKYPAIIVDSEYYLWLLVAIL